MHSQQKFGVVAEICIALVDEEEDDDRQHLVSGLFLSVNEARNPTCPVTSIPARGTALELELDSIRLFDDNGGG
jgi:hypothetical protein